MSNARVPQARRWFGPADYMPNSSSCEAAKEGEGIINNSVLDAVLDFADESKRFISRALEQGPWARRSTQAVTRLKFVFM